MYYEFTDNLSEEEFEEEISEMCHIWKRDFNLPYRIMIDSFGKFKILIDMKFLDN